MLIDYTPKEREALRKIQQEYKQRILDITDAIEKTEDGSPERKALINERAQIRLQLTNEIEAYSDKCERKRFKKLGADPEAILDSAREQIPRLLEYEYTELTAHTTQEDLKGMKLADSEGGRILLRANFMAQIVMYELKLHITALQQDKPRLQELFALIIEGVENSPYTNNEEITLDAAQQTPVEVIRFRRSPLADITTYGLMNDSTSAHLIQDEGIFAQTTDGQLTLRWVVNQAPQKANKEVPVYIALTYEGTESKLTKKLDAYDSAVLNAVATRIFYWRQKNPQKPLYITPQEIWRTMNGKSSRDGKAKPSAAQLRRICASMDKMRFTRFYMDLREELRAFDLFIEDERIESGKIDTYLLNCSKVEFTTEKGRTVTGYRIAEEPILYTYNVAKKHILYVPFEMLDTSLKTSDSENVTEFRNYLLQQVQLMKNAAEGGKNGKYFKRNSVILLETIYAATGTTTPEERAAQASFNSENARQTYLRKTRKADRGKIEGILDAWTAKGWIKGYTPVKKGQTVRGYDIDI